MTTGGGVGNGELCDWAGVGHMLVGLHQLHWLSSVELCPVGAMTSAGIGDGVGGWIHQWGIGGKRWKLWNSTICARSCI